ncbi:hypothetical protein DRA4_1612 [Lactococcus lactis subsp. lactis bv. diacetylactis]|uniref:Uncharacterized protein n=1 Tax=Lactococcus lactis subsp. lactis TaxID=1360 RepID=A0A0V8DDV8_LACLL|nr:hypothetical protein LMG8526_1307 [Lactococcus lactis subsp. lactis]KSU24944.1 hypothetical protein N42_2163 [Lactococcus lactis subsp. lactis]KZK11502.1 hypothetical protein DRA4_1612 [Lactococcus lactis subsp. lactis bv. diacetylactis]
MIIIFILIIKLFSNSVNMSELENKIESIVQEEAIAKLEEEEEKKNDDKK